MLLRAGNTEGAGEGGEEFGVFGGVAYRDADGFGETHPGQGTNDDAFVKEFIAKRFGAGADGDEKKIGFAGDGSEAEGAEFVEKAAAFGPIHFDGVANVVGVVESSESGGLTYAGDVEGSAEFVHFGDESWMADAVADAESGEAVDFGESAKGEDVVVLAEEFESVGKIVALGVFAIGFIENDEDIAGNSFEESGKFAGAKGSAGGIVGIGNVDDAGLRSDDGGDGV